MPQHVRAEWTPFTRTTTSTNNYYNFCKLIIELSLRGLIATVIAHSELFCACCDSIARDSRAHIVYIIICNFVNVIDQFKSIRMGHCVRTQVFRTCEPIIADMIVVQKRNEWMFPKHTHTLRSLIWTTS